MKSRLYVRIIVYERPKSGLTPDLCTLAQKFTPCAVMQGRLKKNVTVGGQLYLESRLEDGTVLSPSLKCGPIIYKVANFVLTDRWICQILKVPALPKGVSEITKLLKH